MFISLKLTNPRNFVYYFFVTEVRMKNNFRKSLSQKKTRAHAKKMQ